jgi:hypothetical protein
VNNQNLNENLVFILERQEAILEAKTNSEQEIILEGIAAVFGEENNNGRIYEESEYLPHMDYLQEKIAQKRLLGELDHPEKFDVSLKNISHVIEALDYDKDKRSLKIKVRLLDTPAGKIAKSLVEAGVPLSISSRAAGNVGPDKKVQIKKIFTYDLVADPGFKNAQLYRVNESIEFSFEEYKNYQKNSVIETLSLINESLGLKNDSLTQIYSVSNNEEFEKLLGIDKINQAKMDNNKEFVTADELNKYSMYLKEQMKAMKEEINSLKSAANASATLEVSESEVNDGSDERIAKLEKYCTYLGENLDSAIRYGEYLAKNLDDSISYSKYLAKNLDESISYSKYLAENLDKTIGYTEYVAENVDKNIEYSKYLAEKLDTNISYSEYLAENLDQNISYSEYIAENLDTSIAYSEHLSEKVNQGISYSEYLAENLNKGISYTEYVAENLNKGLAYSEYLAEKLDSSIRYSEYIAESVAVTPTSESAPLNENAKAEAELAATADLNESGFAGDYADLGTKIDKLIESVNTQKTESLIKEAESKVSKATTQKAINESQETEVNEGDAPKTGFKFIDEMPGEFRPVWENLNESQQDSIKAQAALRRLETDYQIRNFWSTRQLGVEPIGLQKLNENAEIPTAAPSNSAYGNSYLEFVGKELEKRFK